jgi:hypothetical protein
LPELYWLVILMRPQFIENHIKNCHVESISFYYFILCSFWATHKRNGCHISITGGSPRCILCAGNKNLKRTAAYRWPPQHIRSYSVERIQDEVVAIKRAAQKRSALRASAAASHRCCYILHIGFVLLNIEWHKSIRHQAAHKVSSSSSHFWRIPLSDESLLKTHSRAWSAFP